MLIPYRPMSWPRRGCGAIDIVQAAPAVNRAASPAPSTSRTEYQPEGSEGQEVGQSEDGDGQRADLHRRRWPYRSARLPATGLTSRAVNAVVVTTVPTMRFEA